MDELTEYMRAKLREMQERRANTVTIDCVEFMQMLKLLYYIRHIRRILEDEI